MILKLKHQTMDIVIVRFHQGGAPYRAANGTLNLTMDKYNNWSLYQSSGN